MLSDPGVGQWLVQPHPNAQLRQPAGSGCAGEFGFAFPLIPPVPELGNLPERSPGAFGGSTARPTDNGE
jgi:hypothetical protein